MRFLFLHHFNTIRGNNQTHTKQTGYRQFETRQFEMRHFDTDNSRRELFDTRQFDIRQFDTTNAVEAWHRSFNSTVGCHHPTIWKFIQALKLEQGIVEVKQMKFLAGEKPTKRIKWQHQEETLKNIIQDYLNRTMLEFLKGIAHHIGMD